MTNPLLMQATLEQGGVNLLTGWLNLWEDICHFAKDEKPIGTENYVVGKNLATTKGKVIYRHELFELIQYESTSESTYAESILIVPAWIMKYYILDLSEHNSLVKYLVNQGYTVFIISWKNPTKEYQNVGMEDYLKSALGNAISIIQDIIPQQKIHAVGYCLGGTLLALFAAWIGKKKSSPLKTMTLLTTQIDFQDAGELQIFIDEKQLENLEKVMQRQGYLDKFQMKAIFQWLRSNELIWSNMISNYLMGERALQNDLMAWNADATRMPYKMHSEYLRKFYLNNELAEGKYTIDNKTVSLSDIDIPVFAVGTKSDHIAPWQSVYKIHLLTNIDMTFILITGGHNAGIISEPGHPRRTYQIKKTPKNACYTPPDTWQKSAISYEGSWWPEWDKWLKKHNAPQCVSPPKIGSRKHPPLEDSPGRYVFEK